LLQQGATDATRGVARNGIQEDNTEQQTCSNSFFNDNDNFLLAGDEKVRAQGARTSVGRTERAREGSAIRHNRENAMSLFRQTKFIKTFFAHLDRYVFLKKIR
jgi:hypothetical protein